VSLDGPFEELNSVSEVDRYRSTTINTTVRRDKTSDKIEVITSIADRNRLASVLRRVAATLEDREEATVEKKTL
jgi:hypothetical protein